MSTHLQLSKTGQGKVELPCQPTFNFFFGGGMNKLNFDFEGFWLCTLPLQLRGGLDMIDFYFCRGAE